MTTRANKYKFKKESKQFYPLEITKKSFLFQKITKRQNNKTENSQNSKYEKDDTFSLLHSKISLYEKQLQQNLNELQVQKKFNLLALGQSLSSSIQELASSIEIAKNHTVETTRSKINLREIYENLQNCKQLPCYLVAKDSDEETA